MIERETATVVGDVGFIGPPGEDGAVEHVHVVVAGCDPQNVASIRILERLGFTLTGETAEQLRWCVDAAIIA